MNKNIFNTMVTSLLMLSLNFNKSLALSFLEQPSNVCAVIGGNASFGCALNGAQMNPTGWYINGETYLTLFLKSRHTHEERRITIHNVMSTDNGTTYQCYFELANNMPHLNSTVGRLFVHADQLQSQSSTLEKTDQTLYEFTPVPSQLVYNNRTSLHVVPFITTAMTTLTPSIPILQPELGLNPGKSVSQIPLICGFSVGLAVLMLVLAATLSFIAYKRCHKKKNKEKFNDVQPVYQEIIISTSKNESNTIKMEENNCYGQSLQMDSCPAYDTIKY